MPQEVPFLDLPPETPQPLVFGRMYLMNAERYGVSLLCGGIDDTSASQIVTELFYLSYMHRKPPLLVINSPGGGFEAALSIIDAMESLPGGVATLVCGEACSAALLIFMAGTKGDRWISTTAQLMSHHYSTGMHGSGKEIKAEQKRMKYLDGLMESLYTKYSGLPLRAIRSLLKTESSWITPQEAVKKGMADHVGVDILKQYLTREA
jgi:ATP-dependent Clp protease protease subunit